MEIVHTESSTYVGNVVTGEATSFDEFDNDIPCIILEPLTDRGVEIWIPLKSIVSRNVIMYAD